MLGLQKVVRAIKNKFQDYKNVRGAVSEAETETHLAITPSRLEGKFLSGVYTNSQGSRPYKLYVPGSYSPRKAAPLLVAERPRLIRHVLRRLTLIKALTTGTAVMPGSEPGWPPSCAVRAHHRPRSASREP